MEEEQLDFDYAISMQELCRLLDVTPNTIRNYDKYHAINSRRSENGYRYYLFNDIHQCLKLKSFTHLGLTIKESAKLCMQADYDEICARMDALQKQKERELELLTMQQEYLRDFRRDMELLKTLDGRIAEAERPGLYWLNCQKGGSIRRDDAFKRIIRKWSGCVPFTQPCNVLEAAHLGPSSACQIGYFIKEKYAALFDDLELPQTIHFPARKCLATVVHANVDTPDYYSVVRTVTDYLEKHHLTLTEDLFAAAVSPDMATPWRPDAHYDYYLCYFCVD